MWYFTPAKTEGLLKRSRQCRIVMFAKIAKYASMTIATAFLAAQARAVVYSDLYEASVIVADRSTELRLEGFQAALSQVLVGMTGKRDAPLEPGIELITASAQDYVLRFYYEGDPSETFLRVKFDANKLERALTGSGLPVWGAQRPSTIVWLAIDNGSGQRRLVGSDDSGQARGIMERAATLRGVPLVWPLLDGEDLQQVSFTDVWAGFHGSVVEASQRYGADAILIGKGRTRNGQRLDVEWTLQFGDVADRWHGFLEEGPHRAADLFAQRFALQGDPENVGEAQLQIEGVDNLGAYGKVSRYLERLSMVQGVAVERMSADIVVYRLDIRGATDKLQDEIALGSTLTSLGMPDDGTSRLRYRISR